MLCKRTKKAEAKGTFSDECCSCKAKHCYMKRRPDLAVHAIGLALDDVVHEYMSFANAASEHFHEFFKQLSKNRKD